MRAKSQASWSLRTEKVNPCDTTLLLPHQTIRELCMIPQAPPPQLAFKSASLETLLGARGSSDMSHLISLHVCSVGKLCRTLCDPMDCRPPGYSVHGTSRTRILEWVEISSSMRSSWHKDWTCVSWIGRRILYHWATWEAWPAMNLSLLQTLTFHFVWPHCARGAWAS